jgi:lactoylglutathione lyase
MKFAYTIVYVNDVPATIAFYQKAFGQKLAFLHESELYAEMETGGTALAFAHFDMAHLNQLPIRPNYGVDSSAAGIEIAFTDPYPQTAYDKAVAAGAKPVKAPERKPWGQIVGYVRDLNGVLVEIASPMDAPKKK